MLFQWMKRYAGEREFGYFPGNRDFFYRLYQAGKDMDLLDYAVQTIQQDHITGRIVVHTSIMDRFKNMCERNLYQTMLIAEAEKYLHSLAETRLYKQSFTVTLLIESYIIAKLLQTYFKTYPSVQIIQARFINLYLCPKNMMLF